MNDFTTGNPTRQIVMFALPMLIGNLFQQIYGLADAMVVGRYVGGLALAAVGSSTIIINFTLAVFIGLTTGASIVISQFFGAKEEDKLKKSVSTSFVFLLILGAAVSLAGYFLAPHLMKLLDVPEDIFANMLAYLRIIMVGTIFPVIYNMYTAYLRALGDSKRPLYILIIAVILNIGLDLLFVAVFKWGVAGAAWATIASQAVSAVLAHLYANHFVPLLKIERLSVDKGLLRLILRYSLPTALQMSLTSLANLTIMRLVNSFGAVSVAGYTAAVRIDQFAMIPMNNLSMAVSTFIAQNMGAGLEDRAKKGLRSAMLIMLSLAIILSLFVLILGRWLISMFVAPTDIAYAEILNVGVKYLSTLAYFYFLFAIFFSFNGFFRGVGDAVIVMALTISSLTIRAVAAHLLVAFFQMGPEAVAFSIPVGWGLCSIFCLFYYKKRLWAGKVAVRKKAA